MGSVAGTLERTSVPSPGRIWIASQPMWSEKASLVSSTRRGAGGEPGRERGLDAGQREPALARRKAELARPRAGRAGRCARSPSARGPRRSRPSRLAQDLPAPPAPCRSRRCRRRRSAGAAGRWGSRPGRGRSGRGASPSVDPHLGELVDGEVAERVRECRRPEPQRDRRERAGERGEADPQPAPAHRRPPSARSRPRRVERAEPRALRTSSRRSSARACSVRPARRAIIPAW